MVDVTNPIISVISPQPGSKNNSLNSTIIVELEDAYVGGTGVDTSTIDFTVNGEYAFRNGILQPGFDGYFFDNPDGYNIQVQVTRDAYYSPLESVNSSVSARDFANNPAATRVFSFITLDNVPPTIEDISPPDGTGQVASSEPITFSLRTTPYETAININTLVVTATGLEGEDAYGNPIVTVFIAPDSLGQLVFDQREVSITEDADGLGFSIQIIPLTPYPLASQIVVDISVSDLAGNNAATTSTFTTSDSAAPRLVNPLPTPDSVGNSLLSAINFTVADRQENGFFGSGVNKNSIEVTVDGIKAIEAGFPQDGFNITIDDNPILNGFDIVISSISLLPPRRTINVLVVASDNNFNVLTENYVFTTEDVIAPEIIFISPNESATSGLPQNLALIIDFKSEVAVGELDIASISIFLNSVPAFDNNSFQPGFGGLAIATTETTLTVTITKDTPFALGEAVTMDAYVSDVFGNDAYNAIDFTITTDTALRSFASPPGGIFDQTNSVQEFPPVGSFLDVTLTANDAYAGIAFTLDGSDPVLDAYYVPLGTTQIFSTPIRIIDGGIIRFFAFNSITGEREDINNEVYVFSECPENETWDGFALRDGLEYTNRTTLNQIQFINDSALIADIGQKIGTATYIHDLGRSSFVDELEFTTRGTTRFRVRVADTQEGLPAAQWCNLLDDLVDNNLVDLFDGYGPKITTIGNDFHIEGRNQLDDLFADEAYGRINTPLFDSFTVNAEMRLIADLENIVGAKSFLRIRDDVFSVEVQQFVSKINTIPNSQLLGESSLIGEVSTLYFNDAYVDAYTEFTDGYSGFVELIQPPEDLTEIFDFITTTTTQISDAYDLDPNTNDVFNITSITFSVYNQFEYSDDDGYDAYDAYGDAYTGQIYSSALAASVDYKRFVSDVRTSFAISVLGKSLDSTTATITSENLDATLDQFIPAETNGVFSTTIFLEAGDYNFRFSISDGYDTRIVSNPFLFSTEQDLSAISIKNDADVDILITDTGSFEIASVVKLIAGEYVFDFVKDFPLSTADILNWQITRNGTLVISSTDKIVVDNVSGASLGQDSNGIVSNLVIDQRREVEFIYMSASATSISVIGTFNSFNPTASLLIEGLDPTEIEKAFDGNLSTAYENDHKNFHRVTIFPELPLIVDRVKFTTGVEPDAYQRTRLLIDELAVPRSNYIARTEDDNEAPYLNNVDVLVDNTSSVEWSFVQVGTNLNRTPRDSVGLLTRFDALSGVSREHLEIDIFTIPELPQLIADYFVPLDQPQVVRKNKSDFAVSSNQVVIRHGIVHELSNLPVGLEAVRDDGLIDNFIQANIITDNPSIPNSIFVDIPHLFNVGERVIMYDGLMLLRATILRIEGDDVDDEGVPDTNSGLVVLDSPVLDSGIMVKDYIISEDENDFFAKLEVPNFEIVFTGVIRDFTPAPTQTILEFENFLDIDATTFLGGRLTYPLLEKPVKIIEVQQVKEQSGSAVVDLIKVTIDQELLVTHPSLGVIVEVYNSTKIVCDYTISKTDGSAVCMNESLLCSGVETEIDYQADIPPFQAPQQMLCFDAYDGYDGYDVKIEVIPTINTITLQELDAVAVDFFNGVEAEAPSLVRFTVNDEFTVTQSLNPALIVDGYRDALYNPAFPNTGQIVKFEVPTTVFIPDAYNTTPFTSLCVEFTGQPRYCIGEIEALVDTSLINSRCRIVLDEQELFLEDTPASGAFTRYQIQVDRGSLIIFCNGVCVLRRPILFTNPKFEFGGTGKTLDDLVVADIRNIFIDQFFSISPAKIQKVGRFIEIEGTVVS